MCSMPSAVRANLGNPSILIAITALGAVAGVYGLCSSTTRHKMNAPTKIFGRGPAFTSLRLHSVETLSPDTKRFRFELPTADAVSGLPLTAALLTVSRPKGQFLPVVRPYTPISNLNEPGFIDFAIKKYPNGRASAYIHSLTPGESLFFLGSLNAYPWKQNKYSHITLIAGGAGITPMYQLIKGIFADSCEKTKVTLIFGVNTNEDILFRDEFAKYEEQFPGRFKAVYTVSNPSGNSPYHKGRITKDLIRQVMPDSSRASDKIFVCGPPTMEASLLGPSGLGKGVQKGILEELGYTKDQVHKF